MFLYTSSAAEIKCEQKKKKKKEKKLAVKGLVGLREVGQCDIDHSITVS